MNDQRSHQGLAWVFVPVVLLGTMFAGWGVMLKFALDDPAFGIEPDYYDKAVHFDQYQAQLEESRRLGWTLDVAARVDGQGAFIEVTLRDRNHRPIDDASVKAAAFHNARSSHIQTLEFRSEGTGRYTHRLGPSRPGVWEFRFEVLEGARRFVHVTRVSLGHPDGA